MRNVVKHSIVALLLGFVLAACATTGGNPPIIDGTTPASAEASWARMLETVDRRKRIALLQAMLQINMAGVESVYDIAGNDELKHPSITRIREQVDGMDADGIIALGERVGTVRIEVFED